MPSVSKAQQRLMGGAEHGAAFPMAQKIRQSMTHQQMHDFAAGPMKGKPAHISLPHPHKNLGAYLHPAKAKAAPMKPQAIAPTLGNLARFGQKG